MSRNNCTQTVLTIIINNIFHTLYDINKMNIQDRYNLNLISHSNKTTEKFRGIDFDWSCAVYINEV